MPKIYEMSNTIQDYAWGDKTALKVLFGISNPNNKPQAEIWMGGHPKASSNIKLKGEEISLIEFINSNPKTILGTNVKSKYNGKLPFLFKVLNAGEPLSIQSHPTLQQAKMGFKKENAKGIGLTEFNRNYKDDNHKPELICALTEFKAMNGFREISVIVSLLDKLNIDLITGPLNKLRGDQTKEGLKVFYTWLMNLDKESVLTLTNEAISRSIELKDEKAFETLLYLNSFYHNDIGIMCPVMLNVIDLKPGEAMYLDAGELHAYLQGTGMEIMANSDNVLRGGLTPKYIDVPELLSTLSFNSGSVDILTPKGECNNNEKTYKTPAAEFEFSKIETVNKEYKSSVNRSVEILFCSKGVGKIKWDEGSLDLRVGRSYFIPFSVKGYTVSGDVTLYKGCVPVQKNSNGVVSGRN